MNQCNCKTLKGTPCKNKAKSGTSFCHLHQNCVDLVSTSTTQIIPSSPRSTQKKVNKPKQDKWNRPQTLPWPNYEAAYELLSSWEQQNRWDSDGMQKKDWDRNFAVLRSYEPWATFLREFADYLKDDKDFKQLYANGLRDSKGDMTVEEVAETNLPSFAHEFKTFLEDKYGFRWEKVSGEKEGALVILDYSKKPPQYFELRV